MTPCMRRPYALQSIWRSIFGAAFLKLQHAAQDGTKTDGGRGVGRSARRGARAASFLLPERQTGDVTKRQRNRRIVGGLGYCGIR